MYCAKFYLELRLCTINIGYIGVLSDNVLLSIDGSVKLAGFGYAAQLTKEYETRQCCWNLCLDGTELIVGLYYCVNVGIGVLE